MLSLYAWLLPEWWHLSLAIACSGCIFFLYCSRLLESPQWLASKGRFEDAHDVLCQMAKCNGNREPTLPESLQADDNADAGTSTEQPGLTALVDRRLLCRTVIMCLNWFTT